MKNIETFVKDIISKGVYSSKREFIATRHALMHILYYIHKPALTMKRIAALLSIKNHTSIMYGRDRVADWFKHPDMYSMEYNIYNHIVILHNVYFNTPMYDIKDIVIYDRDGREIKLNNHSVSVIKKILNSGLINKYPVE